MASSDSQTPSELFQQGDVLFFRVDALPDNAGSVARKERGLVIAEGEVTGHAHVIEAENARLYTLEEILYLVVEEEVDCIHEEHDTVRLSPGVYRIGGVREVDYTAIEERERREQLRVDLRQGRVLPVPRPSRRREQPMEKTLRERRQAVLRQQQRERERVRRRKRGQQRKKQEAEWRRVRD